MLKTVLSKSNFVWFFDE